MISARPCMLDGQLPPLSDGLGLTGKLDITSLRLQAFATHAESAVAGFVKDELVTKYGVTVSQLVACTPHIDAAADDENMPRVDLLI